MSQNRAIPVTTRRLLNAPNVAHVLARLAHQPKSSSASGTRDCCAKPLWVNSQEIVHFAIDQNHRDLFTVLGHKFWIIKQRQLFKFDVLASNDLVDHGVGPLTQVTTGPANQRDLYLSHDPPPAIHNKFQGWQG
jgi:hypothetical protein